MRMMLLISVFIGGLAVTHIMYIEMIHSIRIHSPNYERIVSDKDLIANVDDKHRAVISVLRNGLLRQIVLDFSRDYEKE